MELVSQNILSSHYVRDGTSVDLKYDTMTNHGNVSVEEYEKYKNHHLGFNKSLIWYYEKTRLLIKLIGDVGKLIDPNIEYAVLWHLRN